MACPTASYRYLLIIGLGRGSHAGPGAIGNFTPTIEFVLRFVQPESWSISNVDSYINIFQKNPDVKPLGYHSLLVTH